MLCKAIDCEHELISPKEIKQGYCYRCKRTGFQWSCVTCSAIFDTNKDHVNRKRCKKCYRNYRKDYDQGRYVKSYKPPKKGVVIMNEIYNLCKKYPRHKTALVHGQTYSQQRCTYRYIRIMVNQERLKYNERDELMAM